VTASDFHRGIHYLSELSTGRIENARAAARDFIGAESAEEIVFTSGTTQAINLVAGSFRETLRPGDEVIVSAMEHHSNLSPWHNACRRSGAVLKIIPVDENGDLRLDTYRELLSDRAKLVAVTCCSNVTGAVNPLTQIIEQAHARGAAVLVDAAQFMRHSVIDVQALDCDFLCFSGHKLMGASGVGVLYGKRRQLESLQPVSFGGGMVDTVTLEETTVGALPFRFEAGTPNISGIIGLEAAIKYLTGLGIAEIAAYEKELLDYAEERLREFGAVRLAGAPRNRAGVISFNLDGFHHYDVAMLLDRLGIAARSGHLCAQPLLSQFGLPGVVRVSPAFYNTSDEIDKLADGLRRIISIGGNQQ